MTRLPSRRPRDPVGRRQAIIEAAARIIVQEGLVGLSHRRVATLADVPVGSTTYYFRDLDALRQEALAYAADAGAHILQEWSRALDEHEDLPATLARLTADYLANSNQHRTLTELYTAASHRSEVQPLARRWFDGLVELLTPRIGRQAAEAVAVFLDGVFMHALITDIPLSTASLTDALQRLTRNLP